MESNKRAGQIILSFAIVILIGAMLLSLPISSKNGQWFPFIDALFTSTSAVCVTGLVVVNTLVHFSLFGQIVIILLIQIGGLGFITISSLIFLMLGKKISYKNRLTIQDSLNQDNNEGVLKLVKNIIILVVSCEFYGFLCLLPSLIGEYGVGYGIFYSMFLSISAFCNAGFTDLVPFHENVLVLLPIMILIVLGGIGHLSMFELFNRKKKISLHTKIVLISTATLIFFGAFLFAILEWNNTQTLGNMSASLKILNSFFQSITLRTAGFSTIDQGKLTTASIILSDILMFIGGNSGSIAGGVKITTIFVLFLTALKGTNSKGDIVFKNKKIGNVTILKCIRIFSFSLGLIVISSFLIGIIEGSKFSTAAIFFETISAISTVGVTLGITSQLSAASKIIVALLMFIGRVQAMTIAIVLSNKKEIRDDIEYTDAKIMVG